VLQVQVFQMICKRGFRCCFCGLFSISGVMGDMWLGFHGCFNCGDLNIQRFAVISDLEDSLEVVFNMYH
jgi:hypothetical protein